MDKLAEREENKNLQNPKAYPDEGADQMKKRLLHDKKSVKGD